MTTVSPNSNPSNSVTFDTPAVAVNPTKPKSKPRKRVNTAEKRSQHNAIERARRETLNSKFIDLARLLPALANNKRPSKSAIVNGSIKHLTYQRSQRLLAAKNLREVAARHDALAQELNLLRQQCGLPTKDESSAWNKEMEEICSVEAESFGTFANFDGEDAEEEESELSVEQAANIAASFTGLITPRNSTDIDPMTHTQAMFGNMPIPPSSSTPFDTLNWSNDFATSMGQAAMVNNPFAFVSDRVDSSSSASPANSQPATVVTPPTSNSVPMPFDHTPSPQSSFGAEEPKANLGTSLTPAQLLFLQNNAMTPQVPVPQGSQHYARPGLNMLAMQHQIQPPSFAASPFAQQMFASMFPNQNNILAQADIQQWRKMTGVPHSAPVTPDFAPRNNMGLTLNADGLWPESQAVAGF